LKFDTIIDFLGGEVRLEYCRNGPPAPANGRKAPHHAAFRFMLPENMTLLHRIGARSRTILSAARLDLREVIGWRRSTGDNGARVRP
jgi:hypothetical protein